MNLHDLKIVLKLLLAYARQRAGRTLLTLLSTVAAASVVVWVVSSYDSLVSKFDDFADKYLGRYSVIALPMQDPQAIPNPFGTPPPLDEKILVKLREDPAVSVVDTISQVQVRIENPRHVQPVPDAAMAAALSGPLLAERIRIRNNQFPTLVATDATEPPYTLLEGEWLKPSDAAAKRAVISAGSAGQLNLKLGDIVHVTGNSGRENLLTIAGIVEQRQALPNNGFIVGIPSGRAFPLTRGPAISALYVPRALAAEITGEALPASFAGIVLKPGAKLTEFQTEWAARWKSDKVLAELQSLADVEAELSGSSNTDNLRSQVWSATGISLLASLFIIFTTLSMGVDERVRQFAMLRAVALTKAQIALLILLEGVLLGLVGWAGGLLAGWGLLRLMALYRPQSISVDTSLGMWCVILAGLCAVGGALAASILPAWKATRVSPLEAMAPAARAKPLESPWLTTLCGLVLISINPLLVFVIPMPDNARYLTSAVLGCTSMAIGFILLAPLAIILTERWLGPLVARLMGLNPRLVALQLSSNFWRTLGTSVALTLGLGLYVSMQVWGYSMLHPYFPGEWVPDLVVAVTPSGVPDEDIDAIRRLPGIRSEQFAPLAVQQVKFLEDVTGARARLSATRQDNCVMLGVDPQIALGGEHPMFDFRYVSGNRDEVLKRFKAGGRYCLVPDHFSTESGLRVGDKFAVRLPEDPEKSVTYEIAGVVNMDGWHWMSKVGLRNQTGGRTTGLMFAPFDQVRNDFSIQRIGFFWMNLDGTATEDEIKASIQKIANKHFDPKTTISKAPSVAGAGPPRTATVGLASRNTVRQKIRERADTVIWLISQLPLITLGVTSLGVVNTILASIRARQWEMGVLRATGVTRFGLFRMILVESVLIGLVACLLSFSFGLLAGYCGVGITRYANTRGGMETTLVIPWAQVLLGFGMTLSLCLTAAIWPAIRTGRTEPLVLLQQGRTAI